MAKICDNTSVGVIIKNNQGEMLLIERKSWPYGMAAAAGHLDGDRAEDGAVKEIAEEVGLTITNQDLVLEKGFNNPCKREGGDHHHWYVYEAGQWQGEPLIREEEKEKVRRITWVSVDELRRLAARTEVFASGYEFDPAADLTFLTRTLCEDIEWQDNPGLEPVWYLILKDLRLI